MATSASSIITSFWRWFLLYFFEMFCQACFLLHLCPEEGSLLSSGITIITSTFRTLHVKSFTTGPNPNRRISKGNDIIWRRSRLPHFNKSTCRRCETGVIISSRAGEADLQGHRNTVSLWTPLVQTVSLSRAVM